MSTLVWIGVALVGGAGAVLRFLVDRAVAGRFARSLPLGTLTVKPTGAALLGVVTGLALSRHAGLVAGTAAVGSYTTFSTWLVETHRLSEENQKWAALANVVVSIALGLTAAAGRMLIGEHL